MVDTIKAWDPSRIKRADHAKPSAETGKIQAIPLWLLVTFVGVGAFVGGFISA